MSSVVITSNIVGLDSKIGMSLNATHEFTGTRNQGDVVTVGGTEYELDLSAVGTGGGLISVRNGGVNQWTGSGWQYVTLLFGFSAGSYVSKLLYGQSAIIPLMADRNKFYMRAYLSKTFTILPVFTADASTNVLTFASAHGLAENDGIFVWTEGTIPAGLVDGTRYIVKTIESTTAITLYDGEGTLDVTSAGSGTHHAIQADAVASASVSYLYHEA